MTKCVKNFTSIILIVFFPLQYCFATISTSPKILVDVDWLAQNLNRMDLKIIDVRSNADYSAGHIPNSVNVPVNSTYDQRQPGGRVGSLVQIKDIFSQVGVDASSHVVIYDDGIFKDAARLFWVLEVYGHKSLSILDGGIKAWTNNNQSLSIDKTKPLPKDFPAVIKPEYLATKLQTRLAINNKNTVIIDARQEVEYSGQESLASRSGRIPSSINIPSTENLRILDSGWSLKPRQELQSLYQHLPKNQRIITYCNKGKESALTYFSLRLLGYDVAHYDGSWVDWGNDTGVPIEQP